MALAAMFTFSANHPIALLPGPTGAVSPWIHRPAFTKLVVASDGSLWLRELAVLDAGATNLWGPEPNAPPVSWYVLSRDGQWLGQVKMPAQFTVYSIGPDMVYGVFRDEDNVERVRAYRVLKSR